MYDFQMKFTDGYNYEQKVQQKKMEEEYRQDCREIAKAETKAEIRSRAQLAVIREKMLMKQAEDERRKANYESVEIGSDGEVRICTKNLQIATRPRLLTNMKSPEMTILRRGINPSEKLFRLKCLVRGMGQEIFFDSGRLGSGTYILGQLSNAGIQIYAPSARAKEYARQLIALLIERGIGQEILIPDEPGWFTMDDEIFAFIEEGELTWKKILEVI